MDGNGRLVTGGRWARPACAVALLACALAGCGRGCGGAVAEVAEREGTVERDQANREGRWEAAPRGARLHMGDGVRTRDASSATLELAGGSHLRLSSHTVLRFLSRDPGSAAPAVHVEEGEVRVEAAGELRLRTRVGVAVIEEGSTLVMRAESDGIRFRVQVGSAYLEEDDGGRHPLPQEGGLVVSFGGVILEREEETGANPPAEAQPPTATPAAAPRPQAENDASPPRTETEEGPARAHLQVPAGESFTVRDARAPTHIGVRFGDRCPGGGVVELLSRGGAVRTAVRGEAAANLRVPPGRHTYRLRCTAPDGSGRTRVAAEGTVRVVRDPGLAPLPRTPPTTMMDMDGRRYTVLYQNLLPEVIVRWRDAPRDDDLELHLTSARGRRVLPTGGAQHTFRSGQLGEGRYGLRFQTRDGKKRSREATLVIGFDNAASTVSLREPADGSFAPGDEVAVSGVALAGWTVTAGSRAMDLDGQRRFSGRVTVPSAQDALALRLSHPRRGVQYYVRRAKENP
jgi:hypothetical protein